mmetsp:Transcript_7553/g.6685  ORF Transcript_7553/g.6685 Transcript_7553/m.6685 type:complete len:210 (+) Transcript_7553:1-630(+)
MKLITIFALLLLVSNCSLLNTLRLAKLEDGNDLESFVFTASKSSSEADISTYAVRVDGINNILSWDVQFKTLYPNAKCEDKTQESSPLVKESITYDLSDGMRYQSREGSAECEKRRFNLFFNSISTHMILLKEIEVIIYDIETDGKRLTKSRMQYSDKESYEFNRVDGRLTDFEIFNTELGSSTHTFTIIGDVSKANFIKSDHIPVACQ